MAITLRSTKGSNLTSNEVDNNFTTLSGSISNIISGTTLAASASFATTALTSTSASYANNATSASFALTASYAANGGGGGGIEFYDQGQPLGTKSKINFIGTGIDAYVGDIDPSMVVVSSDAGVMVTISNVAVHSSVREFEFASGSVSFTGSENYPGYQRVIIGSANFSSVDSDILPSTDGVYDLGSSTNKWFDGYFANNIALGDINITNDDDTLVVDSDIVTTAISADIANIGSINIIEDTISVDVIIPTDGYSAIPESILKIDSGLRILGSTYGTKYVLVNGNGTPEENAVELQAAYDYAKELRALNPTIDTTDRYSVIISPGEYTFNTYFAIDTDGIDVISLTGGRDVVINKPLIDFNSTVATSVWIQDVDHITVRGIDTQTHQFRTEVYGLNVLIENCKGGAFSFAFGEATNSDPSTHYGKVTGTEATFKNCEGRDYSFLPFTRNNFAHFIDCKGGNYSFGYNAHDTLNADCTNCTAGGYSFGYAFDGDAHGSYTNCTVLNNGERSFLSFAQGDGNVSSIITNCIAGDDSFAKNATLTSLGKIINCIGGNGSFFTDTVIGTGVNNGMVINCVLLPKQWFYPTTFTFASTGQGIIRNCINADGTLVNS